MGRLSRRDLVGLAALAAGLVIAAAFIVPRNGGANTPTPSHGQAATTVTPTRLPPSAAVQPANWNVVYYRSRQPGQTAADTQTVAAALDFSYARAPFNDITDGNWSLVAGTTLALAAGETVFTLQHQGSVRVLIDGKEIAADGASNAPRDLRVTIASDTERSAELIIEAIDDAGAFLLRWQ